MVLHQSKFCMECQKPKYFHVIFYPTKYYQNRIFNFNYVIEIIMCMIFDINLFWFIIIAHFYNTFINIKLLLICYLWNNMVINVFFLLGNKKRWVKYRSFLSYDFFFINICWNCCRCIYYFITRSYWIINNIC